MSIRLIPTGPKCRRHSNLHLSEKCAPPPQHTHTHTHTLSSTLPCNNHSIPFRTPLPAATYWGLDQDEARYPTSMQLGPWMATMRPSAKKWLIGSWNLTVWFTCRACACVWTGRGNKGQNTRFRALERAQIRRHVLLLWWPQSCTIVSTVPSNSIHVTCVAPAPYLKHYTVRLAPKRSQRRAVRLGCRHGRRAAHGCWYWCRCV